MKRTFIIALLFTLLASTAYANPLTLNLTATSGVTTLTLSGAGYSASTGQNTFDSQSLPAGYWVAEILSTSGTTSIHFGYTQWLSGSTNPERRPIIHNMAVSSGASIYQVPFMLEPSKHTQFYAYDETSVSPFTTFNVTLFRPDGDSSTWPAPPAVLISSSNFGFGTSGTTTFQTSYPVPHGTRWVEIQPITDAIYISDDFTTPTTADFKIATESVLGVPVDEYRKLRFLPGGVASGYCTVKFWNRQP